MNALLGGEQGIRRAGVQSWRYGRNTLLLTMQGAKLDFNSSFPARPVTA